VELVVTGQGRGVMHSLKSCFKMGRVEGVILKCILLNGSEGGKGEVHHQVQVLLVGKYQTRTHVVLVTVTVLYSPAMTYL
jgi:hypothetical protein